MPIIDVQGLHKRYGDVVAVDDVSLQIEPGEIFGIVGPNGAGKTTTVECISGLRTADRGTVSVAGLDPVGDRHEVRRRVGVQLQESQMPDKLTVREALSLYASFYPRPRPVGDLMTELGLTDKAGTRFSRLSGGQKQRLSIALALIGNPEIVILDELTTGLDPQARRQSWTLVERIRTAGATVVLVTHFMEEAERLCNRVALIDAGRVVAVGTPAALVDGIGAGQRIRFRAAGCVDPRLLTASPHVTGVDVEGDDIVVSGDDGLLLGLATVLSANRIPATHLRMDVPTLDDAFLTLTGHPHEGATQ